MRFWKMQGAGNDFVVLNALKEPLRLTAEGFARLADRRLGIGADQILVAAPPQADGDCSYLIFNADGSPAEHCGNGARCIGRYLLEAGIARGSRARLETSEGIVTVEAVPGGMCAEVGRPDFRPASLPFRTDGLPKRREGDADVFTLTLSDGTRHDVTPVAVGNPHAVAWVGALEGFPVSRLGPQIERHPAFPQRVNAEFVEVLSVERMRFRVWERGAGETPACGTGACAAVAAGIRSGRLGRSVDVLAPGGRLRVEWPSDDAPMRLSGPAERVFSGEMELSAEFFSKD